MADRKHLEALTRRFADEGKLLEAGWVGFRLLTDLTSETPAELDRLRICFMAGAQHLFASIITALDPGTEETADDLRRMDQIHAELEPIRKMLELLAAKARGSA